MSTQTASRCARLGEVLGSLGDLSNHAAELEQFVTGTMGAISRWHDEIDQRECSVRQREEQLADESKRLRCENARLEGWSAECQRRADELQRESQRQAENQSRLEASRAQVEAAQIEVNEKLRRLDGEVMAGNHAAGQEIETLRKRQQELEDSRRQLAQERDRLQQSLDRTARDLAAAQEEASRAKDQLASVRDDVEEVDELRVQLAEAAAELDRHRHDVSAPRSEASATPQRVVELEQERHALEEELEIVRRRAAELAETADGQKRDFESQRTLWVNEMQDLRRALQANVQSRPQPAAASDARVTQPTPVYAAATAAPSQDTALESVMAQFEMLQRDLAKRGTNQSRKSKPRQQEVA